MPNKDLWGIFLLLLTIIGVIKGRHMPMMIPQLFAILSFVLLIYRGFFMKSAYSLLYTSSLWMSITWITGISIERSFPDNVFMLLPFYTMVILGIPITYGHQRVYRRLNPVAIRGLDIEDRNIKEKSILDSIRSIFQTKKEEEIEELAPLVFEIWTEAVYKNR